MGRGRTAVRGTAIALCAAAALTVSACGGHSSSAAGPSDPPSAFGPGQVVGPAPALSQGESATRYRLPAVLDQGTAYLAGVDGVRVVDTASGRTMETIRAQHPLLTTEGSAANLTHPPLVTTAGDARAVVWPFLVKAPGGGNAVELTSIHTDTHTATNVLIGLPQWASSAEYNLSVTPIGAAGTTVVLDVAGGLHHAALTTDAGTGEPLWMRDDFTADAVTDGTVVGAQPDAAPANTEHVVGLALKDGTQRWTQLHGFGFGISSASPSLVAVEGTLPTATSGGTFQLLAAATGTSVATLQISNGLPSRCVYDQTSVTVCYAPTDNHAGARVVVAVDAKTGQQLWSMPNGTNGTEPVPLVTDAWHGLVYATTTEGLTMVYRARSGSPVRASAGPAPVLVNDQAGLALDPNGTNIVAQRPID